MCISPVRQGSRSPLAAAGGPRGGATDVAQARTKGLSGKVSASVLACEWKVRSGMRRAAGLMPQWLASCVVAEAITGAGIKDFAESEVFFVGGLAVHRMGVPRG